MNVEDDEPYHGQTEYASHNDEENRRDDPAQLLVISYKGQNNDEGTDDEKDDV